MDNELLKKIDELCKESGISRRKLQEELNFSSSTITKWKTSAPSMDKLQAVADHFKVDVNYLLGNTPYKNQTEMYADWDNKYPEMELTLPDGTIVEFDLEDSVTFHSTGGSLTYTHYDQEVKDLMEKLQNNRQLYKIMMVLNTLSPKQLDAVENLLTLMEKQVTPVHARYKVK